MPDVLRLLCEGVMIAAPILLVLLAVPLFEWDVDGQRMSYSELWSSGNGLAFAAFLTLAGTGSWGLAARSRPSRWLLVFTPIAPFAVLFPFSASNTSLIGVEVLLEAVATSIGIYICLFHIRAVNSYLNG